MVGILMISIGMVIQNEEVLSTLNTLNIEEFDINNLSSDTVVYAKWKDPNVLEFGQEYCIGTECFYYLRNIDTNHVALLAKKPLDYVAPYQNPNDNAQYGVAAEFTDSPYWDSSVSEYPEYVYNDNCNLKEYIDNYVDYLTTTYGVSVEGRLSDYEDMISMGVDFSKEGTEESLANSPEWVYSISFFTGIAANDYDIYRIQRDMLIATGTSRYAMAGELAFIRPIIILEVNN